MNELLVLTFNGMRYGVWKDSILSVEDVQTLHRLPLSPACIAGMAILDDRTVTLADLSVCIGLPKMTWEKSGHILLMSREEKVAGFVVEGEIGHLAIGPDAVRPMPDYLKTALIDTCAVHEAEPIPVINISLLYSRIQKAETEPPIAEFHVSATERRDIASVKSVRLFGCGKEHFASPAAGIEDEAVRPGPTSRLALIPPHVKGLSFFRESVLPLISLSRKMKLLKAGAEALVLVAEIGGARFAFSVDADEGTLFKKDFTIKPLPPLVESNWIRGAVVRAGEILPLIDLGALMSSRADGADERPLPPRYSPDSRFPFLFGKEDVELMEFSLLGARHALPKAEVEDTVQFRPYRQVPNVQPIVVGVAEHKGGLLPVLDLAMCFGRRSLVTPEWSMLLVKNGDFRALVITEAVFGDRRLELNAQRGVPMVLPHRVVYGCYPDAAVVRLVLNVEALAVHFDKALVKDLLRALSKEMEQAPSEIVSSLLEPDVIGAQAGGDAAVFAQEITPEEEEVSYQQTLVSDEEKGEEEAVIAPQEQREEPVLSAPVEAAAIREVMPAPVQPVVEPVATEAASEPQHVPQPEPEPEPESESVPMPEPEPQPKPEPVPVPAPVVEEEPVGTDSLPDGAASEEASVEKIALMETVAEAGQVPVIPSPSPGETTVPVLQEPPAEERIPERVVPAVPLETGKTDEARASGKKEAALIAEQLVFQRGYERHDQVSERAAVEHLKSSSPRRWKGGLPYIIIVAILIAVFFVSGVFKKPIAVRDAQEPKPEKVLVEKAKPVKKPPVRTPAPVEPPKPVAAAGPVVVFSGTRVYVVKKGDTLWAISKRFTGNPFNYPQVAKENNIENPDLIFPGQEIRL